MPFFEHVDKCPDLRLAFEKDAQQIIQAGTQALNIFTQAVKYLNGMLLSCWCTWMTHLFMSIKKLKRPPLK